MDLSRLADMPWYSDLRPQQLKTLETFAAERSFAAGAALFQQGDYANHVYAVQSGEVAVRHEGRLVTVLGPGDVVGAEEVLNGRRRTTTARAQSPLLVLELHACDVRRLQRQPGGERLTSALLPPQ